MNTDYDIITVGGGLGGAALAKAMAEQGYRVLVVEREEQFKDRGRCHSWPRIRRGVPICSIADRMHRRSTKPRGGAFLVKIDGVAPHH